MDIIRLIIAGIPDSMCQDILSRFDQLRPDIRIVGRSISRESLHQAIKAESPDVVILALEDGEIPQICRQLQDSFPDVGVVGLGDHARRAALHVTDVGLEDLVKMIRVAKRRVDA